MILENFLIALAKVLNTILSLYVWLIIGRALSSWFSPDPYNPIVQFLYRSTEPLLSPIRNALPYLGGIDFSPIVLLLAIEFFKSFLVNLLLDIAYNGLNF
tara:strand:+ start:451 stop:750 length:300 start_codon:yes stop_codon:yes gene_type:complete